MPTFVLHKNNYTQPITAYKQIIDNRKIDFNCNSILNTRSIVNSELDFAEVTYTSIEVKNIHIVAINGIRGIDVRV